MANIKFTTPITAKANQSSYIKNPSEHILKSIIASICGASIPAIIFYLTI
jgi:hypothetical protein